jgi:outer membrane lipoprotein-sorting protein
VKRREFILGTAALGLSGLSLAGARTAEAQGPLDEVARARQGLKSLVARFDQVRVIGLLAAPVASKGELAIVTPSSLRWELFPPDATTYWVTKDGVFVKSARAAKATRAPSGSFGTVLSDMMTFLAGEMKKLEARFALDAKSNPDGSVTIVAKPKTDELKKLITRLELRTNPEKWGVARVVIEEATGDSSTITFQKNERDVKIDPARMQPPA